MSRVESASRSASALRFCSSNNSSSPSTSLAESSARKSSTRPRSRVGESSAPNTRPEDEGSLTCIQPEEGAEDRRRGKVGRERGVNLDSNSILEGRLIAVTETERE